MMKNDPYAKYDTLPIYEAIAGWFDATRGKALFERPWLDRMLGVVGPKPAVLDLGCGSGEPIARYLKERGCTVTGVDGADNMIALCRQRFPDSDWICADMRGLDLGRTFDVVIAWDSFFHLTKEEQQAMFPVFKAHAAPRAALMFTTGPEDGEAWGTMNGHEVYHSSLSPEVYRSLLESHGFDLVHHVTNDISCGGHTIWLAQYR
ncbi:MAG: class I SAM-dependent methyltransferase [Hyphomicrobiales bacterium]|nr:class I SAM-dependent methyltransferase [Hyphomicrobiales bacterium]